MNVTVFYAWQADTPYKVNHGFIEEAANAACERINRDSEQSWNVRVESGAEGAPGMCDIPAEILKKIRNCDIFLADMTLVGLTEKQKKLPNSNVAFELGYAAACHDFGRLVPVVNEAFGAVEEQVFDVKRRWALRYHVAPKSDDTKLEEKKQSLSEKLEEIFRDVIAKEVEPLRKKQIASVDHGIAQREFADLLSESQYHGIKKPAVIYAIKFAWPNPEAFQLMQDAIGATKGYIDLHPHGMTWKDDLTVVELREEGVLRRASNQDKTATKNMARMHRGEENFLLAAPLQENILKNVAADCRKLLEFGVRPPFTIGCSIIGADGLFLGKLHNLRSREPIKNGKLNLPVVHIDSADEMRDTVTIASKFKAAFDYLFRSASEMKSDCFDDGGTWTYQTIKF